MADPHGGFSGYRICHHSHDACCRGFWNHHKDEFPVGQIAQRLDLVKIRRGGYSVRASSGKKYFAALGQFYATVQIPVRPFMHWPQWARDAYLDAWIAQCTVNIKRIRNRGRENMGVQGRSRHESVRNDNQSHTECDSNDQQKSEDTEVARKLLAAS